MNVWRTLCVACAGCLLWQLGSACETGRRSECEDRLGELVAYRAEAIERAFGNLVGVMPAKIDIKFVGPGDAEYSRYSKRVAYDVAQETLIIPRHLASARVPKPLRASAYYWPFYENSLYRQTFPVIPAVDNALWGAYLQEAAKTRGLTWPHASCRSSDITERLACEMLVGGIAEHLTAIKRPLFNSNRLDRIWPEDFAAFRERVWRRDDGWYRDVQRYGGLLLIEPLIDEFGVPLTLFYVAQTPFEIENDNLRASALEYQRKAREWLEAQPASDDAGDATFGPLQTTHEHAAPNELEEGLRVNTAEPIPIDNDRS